MSDSARMEVDGMERMRIAANWLQRLQTSPPDEQALGEWIDWCRAAPENLQAFERLQAVWDAFDWPEVQKPAAALARGAHPERWRRAVPLAMAASALLVVGAIVWLRGPVWSAGDVRALTTAIAEHSSQILADGSRVDLGADSRIVTRYTDSQRVVSVEAGEAYFQVHKEARRPFVVNAGTVRVTAVGTAFGVRRAADRTAVTVSEGVVSIALDTGGRPGHEVRASAGEQVAFAESSNRLTITRVDPDAATAWREGVLKFVDEPLAAVVADVNRYATRRIVIEDPRLSARVYTGTVYEDRIEDWLQALERVFPVRVVTDDGAAIRLVPREPADVVGR